LWSRGNRIHRGLLGVGGCVKSEFAVDYDKKVPDASLSTDSASLRHLPALDGLRGLAVLLVVIYHASYLSPAVVAQAGPVAQVWQVARSGMWCGVDLFFVLSGFLITRILLATRDRPRYFRNFYLRRTVRIFPLYYGVLLALFVALPAAAWLFSGVLPTAVASEPYRTLAERQLWLWTYAQNFLQANGPSQLPGLGHFWSLAIEEQFYLVWPVAVWCMAGKRLAAVCLLLAVAPLAARAMLLANGAEPWAIFHWTFTRCDGLAWGALAATIACNPTWRARAVRLAPVTMLAATAIWLVCGLLAGGWDKLAPAIQTTGYTAIAMLFAAWVLRLESFMQKQKPGWLHTAGLRRLGKYSYAIYLFHWPLCRVAELVVATWRVSPLATIMLQTAFVLATSCVLAWLSWHAWEKHWLKLKRLAPYIAPYTA